MDPCCRNSSTEAAYRMSRRGRGLAQGLSRPALEVLQAAQAVGTLHSEFQCNSQDKLANIGGRISRRQVVSVLRGE